MILFLGVSLGGEGFVEYSVKLSVLRLGVLGLPFLTPLPLTTTPFSIFFVLCVYFQCNWKVELVWGKKVVYVESNQKFFSGVNFFVYQRSRSYFSATGMLFCRGFIPGEGHGLTFYQYYLTT